MRIASSSRFASEAGRSGLAAPSTLPRRTLTDVGATESPPEEEGRDTHSAIALRSVKCDDVSTVLCESLHKQAQAMDRAQVA